jgi:hypothetical protein
MKSMRRIIPVRSSSKVDELDQAGFDFAAEDVSEAKNVWQRTLLLNPC